MVKKILISLIFIASTCLLSCSPVGVIASGGATTMVVAEGDRSLGTVVDDATIKINLSTKFLQADSNLFINVNSNVINGLSLIHI